MSRPPFVRMSTDDQGDIRSGNRLAGDLDPELAFPDAGHEPSGTRRGVRAPKGAEGTPHRAGRGCSGGPDGDSVETNGG